jgi:type IV pilus assembly protein PilY1
MKLKFFAFFACALVFAPVVSAQAILESTSGGNSVALGVDLYGQLNVANFVGGSSVGATNAGAVGISFYMPAGANGGASAAGYYDATSPGCLCEGFGVSATDGSAVSHTSYANNAAGIFNLTSASFTSSATDITATAHLTTLPGLSVEHHSFVNTAGTLFETRVTITNGTGAAITDLRYARAMDWDVPFSEFHEYVTHIGVATTTELETSHDNGFASGNPLDPSFEIAGGTTNVDFSDVGPYDHGSFFIFNFGGLGIGESKEFSIFYGAAPTEAGMLSALAAAGAELVSLGQSGTFSTSTTIGDPVTYGFGFSGVGGLVIPSVPEPGSLVIWGAGMLSLVRLRRRES